MNETTHKLTIASKWKLLSEQNLLSELYHENSKWWPTPWNRVKTLDEAHIRACAENCYKHYRTAKIVPLPLARCQKAPALEEVLTLRHSVRKFNDEPLDIDHIARISRYCNGVIDRKDVHVRRYYPSAGALYPIELYWLIFNVTGLSQGIYHYRPLYHDLELLLTCDPRTELSPALSPDQGEYVRHASCVLVLTGIFPRTVIKYGIRGYRFVLIEAGHAAQNALLVATSDGLGSFPIGGYYDDIVDSLINVDGVEEASLYLVCIGAVAK